MARTNNAALGITGALVLHDELFAQVLEGPEATVTKLFSTIKTDPRHDRVALDQSGPIVARLFGQWAMAIVAEHHQPDMPPPPEVCRKARRGGCHPIRKRF